MKKIFDILTKEKYCDIIQVTNLWQHRIKLVRKMRSQIFRQVVQKFRRQADACQEISVQDDGKYASRLRTKPTGVLCAVLP